MIEVHDVLSSNKDVESDIEEIKHNKIALETNLTI